MKTEPEDSETASLERRAERLRRDVDALLDEADRRRHAVASAVSVKRQLVLHPGVGIVAGAVALALAIGLPLLAIRRARRRRSLGGRASALSQAMRRMMKRPERVAESPPHLPKKVLTAALAAAASTLARKQIEHFFVRGREPV